MHDDDRIASSVNLYGLCDLKGGAPLHLEGAESRQGDVLALLHFAQNLMAKERCHIIEEGITEVGALEGTEGQSPPQSIGCWLVNSGMA